jgi:DNA-binding CsgD family transcriptional regulator
MDHDRRVGNRGLTPVHPRRAAFVGRASERAVLDEMIRRVRAGDGESVVMLGEAGVGKTALTDYIARQVADCRVARLAGTESESAMPLAGVHQLCGPMLEHLGALPAPQQRALRYSFGLESGNAPDLFVVALAVLALLAEVASERPLICLVDDAQWLDAPSRRLLGFVGRRVSPHAILLLLAVRAPGEEQPFAALPSMKIDGLTDADARSLLAAAVPGQLDGRIRDRIVAETRGNPSRLLELLEELTPGELAGGFAEPRAGSCPHAVEQHYAERVRGLPDSTRQLLLLAAADPTGDAAILWRAAQILGIPHTAAAAAESERLIAIGFGVRFCNPALRSAAYAAGSPADRRAAHLALAEATDAEVDPERRVWHLAAAATAPDEIIASELERTASTAQARCGLAGSAAFLERSVQLTAEQERRPERALAAASAYLRSGAGDAAMRVLAEAGALEFDEVQRGRMERLRGQVQYAFNPGPDAPVVLLEAARSLEPVDRRLARETYLEALMASAAAGSQARPGGRIAEVARSARSAPAAPDSPSACDLFLDGLATVVTDGRSAGASSLRRAVDAFLGDEIEDEEFVRWGHLATAAACTLWDWESWEILSAKHVRLARASGALAPLSMALNVRGVYAAWCGDRDAASALAEEHDAVNAATGIGWYSACGLLQAAYESRPDALALMSASGAHSAERGLGQGAQFAAWTTAIVHNGRGSYADALTAAELAASGTEICNAAAWALPELIEAAARGSRPEVAAGAMRRLAKYTLGDSDWCAGIDARCAALVSEGEEAERSYVDAITRLERTPFRTELARAQLLYGEWLRREGRRVDAREHLTTAYGCFATIGAEGFAERAREELLATGAKLGSRDLAIQDELTSREQGIAQLARDGYSNPEIGAELFLSVRTVEWHLRKVFVKLGIKSRRELQTALPAGKRPHSLAA